jgi:hypothetical protein
MLKMEVGMDRWLDGWRQRAGLAGTVPVSMGFEWLVECALVSLNLVEWCVDEVSVFMAFIVYVR